VCENGGASANLRSKSRTDDDPTEHGAACRTVSAQLREEFSEAGADKLVKLAPSAGAPCPVKKRLPKELVSAVHRSTACPDDRVTPVICNAGGAASVMTAASATARMIINVFRPFRMPELSAFGAICGLFWFSPRCVLEWRVNWYYAIGEDIHGPVSRAELDSLFSSGVVSVDTLVLQEGMFDWVHFVDLKKTTQILPVLGGRSESRQTTPPNEDHESAGHEGGGGVRSGEE
jgi:hypothetical protein